ncbi:MAG: vitamin B12-dependent ribonucleotide reductase [Nitrospirae bacterium]|nr:vitamin B12-dependent ribonucleotide reductase [Nitrospirota bacterium]MBF0533555.1 vitamin B12-dependent ribonucleotide reductase [Nitrospirota bacterium]MBF0615921.1 vitamin B12-dependent ribonucleotide reductase [Nitrospirota bacterium]
MSLTQNALKVLQKRYLKKGENGEPVETPHDMFTRVAHAIASNDLNYGKSFSDMEQLERDFYEMMADMAFLPNSPTLMNAGRRLGQLSACFVIPVEDSMESIFEAVKNAALIHKSGGGTGFSFSRLRPSGDVVGSTKGVSSGPISFMTVFDTATEAVKQGGTRRGANMAILRVDHPDIIEFITCKENSHRLNNFNISVGLTEKFMNSVSEDGEYELINPRSGKAVKKVSAGFVFDLIVKHAWQNGEPGIVFLDRINESNPTPHLGLIESTNPCGEQPLLPFESCNLGSLNLSKMLKKSSAGTMEIDYNRIREITHKAVHFLDNVIDLNKYPLKKIEEMTKGNRKIGLGVMGWADMLIQLGIPYNSEEALTAAESVMKFIRDEGRNASEALAEERGVFPNFEGSIHDGKRKQRNATITTIAPTGTLSIIAGCSSGIEPIFAVSYVKTVMDGTRLYEVNPWFEKTSKERGFYSLDLMEDISLRPSIAEVSDIPADVRKVFVTAHDITPEYHIKMQGAFQKFVDNAVSKTVNFSSGATTDDVKRAYMQAFKLGCKGVTVYRDGSREGQVLTTSSHHEPTAAALSTTTVDAQVSAQQKLTPRKRPKLIKGSTESILTGCGNLYVTINEDENGLPFEVFNHIGKAGGCASSQSEAIGRLVSLALRCNIAPDELITQLKGISCHQPIWANGGKISSCADAIAKAVENYCSHSKNSTEKPKSNVNMSMGACPECGGVVEHESGCAVCHDCGYTKCM